MPQASSCKHGPAHFFLLFFKSYWYCCKSLLLGFPCCREPAEMAGAGYGVTPMSRLSQHSSRRRHRSPHRGKHLDSSSPSIAGKKKTPKRKTLSSRYTADFPSKRRKLGLNAIRDPLNLSGEALETHHAAVSPKICDATEVKHEERETKPSRTKARARKAKAKAKARAKAKAKGKANGLQRDLKVEESPRARLLDFKVDIKVENRSAAASGLNDSKAKLLTSNDTAGVGASPEGNNNGDLSPISEEKVNLPLESNEAGPLLLVQKNDASDSRSGDLQKHFTDREAQAQVSNRRPGRKSSCKHFPTGCELRSARDNDAVQLINEDFSACASQLSESQVRGSSIQDSVDGSTLSKQDSSLLEGRFLRPRRQIRKKSKFDNNRLPPWDYVGKRVVVYWPHAKAWYAGKVIKYDDASKKHKIKYDDSDEECISFRRHKVMLERPQSTESADGPICGEGAKEVPSAQSTKCPADKEVVTINAKDKCIVEDSTLLSAFAPRHRFREGFHEVLCNGSAGAVKRVDTTTRKCSPAQKASKNSMSYVTQENVGRTGADDKGGTSGGKAAFVYVRRTKSRQKLDVLSTDLALGGQVNGSDGLPDGIQQERSRKRKKFPLLQQTAEADFSYGNFSDIIFNGGDGSASERTSRKRNKRSLKKLVSQASATQGADAVQGFECGHDRVRKQTARRTGRKLVRKHKLANLVLKAIDRRLPAKWVPRLEDDAEGLSYNTILRQDVTDVHDSRVSADKLFVHESHVLFDGTIHLVFPTIMPDLFTWQLFSILTRVKFCEGGSFDERFSMNGSLQDWMGIFRIILGIIKAMPLGSWMNGRQWQRRILHELWNAMPHYGPALTETLTFLPAEIECIVLKHFRGAVAGCTMTSRHILNLFVCFFIKPYIVATVCEKGASLKVVVEQFLLLDRSKEEGTTSCLRQSLKSIQLQSSSGNADLDFSSYLKLLPGPEDWCPEEGLFLKQMEEWISTAGCAGYGEAWVPVPMIKKLTYLGWQVTSAHLVDRGYASDEIGCKVFRLEQGGAKLRFLKKFNRHCSRHTELGGTAFGQKDGWWIGLSNCTCLNSTLLFTSFLQRSLHEAVGKSSVSSEVSACPSTMTLPLSKVPEQRVPFESTKSIRVKEEPGLMSVVVPIDAAATVHIKMEPDMIISRRNSSITTESTGAAIKEESSVEMYGLQQTLGVYVSKADSMGQCSIGLPLKSDEQHFSGQIDQEYYGYTRSKDIKKLKKSRPRHRSECRRFETPTYCRADLLSICGDVVVRERDASVELQSNGNNSFMVAVHIDGIGYVHKVVSGSTLPENPAELRWKSGNGWALEFPDRERWMLFRSIYNDLCSKTARGPAGKEIPIPGVKMLEDSHGVVSGSSVRPYFAIRYPDDEIAVSYKTGRVLYDLDSEDEAWLRSNEDDSSPAISDNVFEQMIDRLEKEAYRRGEELVSFHDAVKLCQDLGVADEVQVVHAYWSNKRFIKGKSLLRYFQPPLWEQYQTELRIWEAKMERCPPNAQKMLLEQSPRPVMSAFCLQSRSLDVLDMSKKILRQRSQRKIKPPSRSSSEDSYRLTAYRYTDSTWHLSYRSQPVKPIAHLAIGLYQHATRDHFHDQEVPESAKAARATAVEARRVAEIRAAKLQRRFLEFDSALQRAWALLIEYESVTGGEASARGEAFEARMALLFRQCSTLLSRGDDSSEDEPPSHLGKVCKEVGEEFLEAFERKCSLSEKAVLCNTDEKDVEFQMGGHDVCEEASPLLPISMKGSPYTWNGSSLL